MSEEKKIYVKAAGYVWVANFAVLFLGLITRPIVARLLGPSEYGIYALILSTAAFIPVFTLFSLQAPLLYFVAKEHKSQTTVSNFATTATWFLIGFSIVLFFPLYFLFQWMVPALGVAGFIAAYLLAFPLAFNQIVTSYLQGLEKWTRYSLGVAAAPLAAGVLTILFLLIYPTAISTSLGRTLGIFLVSILIVFGTKFWGRFRFDLLEKMVRFFFISSLSTIISTFTPVIDRYFVAATHPTAEVGYYDLALTLVTYSVGLTVVIYQVLAPTLIRNQERLSNFFRQVALWNFIILSVIALAFLYYSNIIVNILLGSQYVVGTTLPMQILSFALIPMAFVTMYGILFVALNDVRTSSVFGILLLVVSLIFNYYFIPQYGAVGAAVATALSYSLVVFAQTVYFKHRYQVPLRDMAVQLILFLGFGLMFWWVAPFGFFAKSLAFLIYGLVTLYVQRIAVLSFIHHLRTMRPAFHLLDVVFRFFEKR